MPPAITDKIQFKYGCSNDGFKSGAYRCRFCGCKQFKSEQMQNHEVTCKHKLIRQLQFMCRDDYILSASEFNTIKDYDNIFYVMDTILKKNNFTKVNISKPELVHTSEPVSYKKSEDLIPLNMPISNTHTPPVSPTKPNKPIRKKQIKQDIVKLPIEEPIEEPVIDITDSPISYDSDTETINEVVNHKTKVITNINILESDSDDDYTTNDITIYATDPALKHLTDEDYNNIQEICLDYINTNIPFYIVLKNFNNEDNKITYLHIVNSDKLEFQMINMNEDIIVDNDYIINRNRYMSGISSNYYEIEYDLNYDIHNE